MLKKTTNTKTQPIFDFNRFTKYSRRTAQHTHIFLQNIYFCFNFVHNSQIAPNNNYPHKRREFAELYYGLKIMDFRRVFFKRRTQHSLLPIHAFVSKGTDRSVICAPTADDLSFRVQTSYFFLFFFVLFVFIFCISSFKKECDQQRLCSLTL